eukprot:5467347-Pyramimonas_sp.AAC.1
MGRAIQELPGGMECHHNIALAGGSEYFNDLFDQNDSPAIQQYYNATGVPSPTNPHDNHVPTANMEGPQK